jgi:hypothetical protein
MKTKILRPEQHYIKDEEARDYLPHMYGAANYAVIDYVASLPLKSF